MACLVSGYLLPGFGKLAVRVVGAVLRYAHGVGALDQVAMAVVLHQRQAVGAAAGGGRIAGFVGLLCAERTVDLHDDVAEGVALEFGERDHHRAVRRAGVRGGGHGGGAAEGVVPGEGRGSGGVGHVGQVANGVVAVAGDEVAAHGDGGRVGVAVVDVDAGLAGLAVGGVPGGAGDAVVGTGGRGPILCGLREFDALGQVAPGVVAERGAVMQRVQDRYLLAAPVVVVVRGEPQACLRVLQLRRFDLFAESVVAIAGDGPGGEQLLAGGGIGVVDGDVRVHDLGQAAVAVNRLLQAAVRRGAGERGIDRGAVAGGW